MIDTDETPISPIQQIQQNTRENKKLYRLVSFLLMVLICIVFFSSSCIILFVFFISSLRGIEGNPTIQATLIDFIFVPSSGWIIASLIILPLIILNVKFYLAVTKGSYSETREELASLLHLIIINYSTVIILLLIFFAFTSQFLMFLILIPLLWPLSIVLALFLLLFLYAYFRRLSALVFPSINPRAIAINTKVALVLLILSIIVYIGGVSFIIIDQYQYEKNLQISEQNQNAIDQANATPVPTPAPIPQNSAMDNQRLKDMAKIQAAIDKYHSDTNSFPDNLSVLSPNYLTTIPTDPVTKNSYGYNGYTKKGTGYEDYAICGLFDNPSYVCYSPTSPAKRYINN